MTEKTPFLTRARRTLIGDRAFYAMVFAIVIPIIIQNAISNFVNLLDNIMVGRTGTDPMTGVSIVNQLIFIFNISLFGAVAGPGIFSAQFHGAKNPEGERYCMRFKLYLALGLTVIAITLFSTIEEPLIRLYLNESDAVARTADTLAYGKSYLKIMVWGLPAFALSTVYASSLREAGETSLPMIGGITAVFVNMVLNYILIYGHLGFEAMGVRGAALATVISRYVELLIVTVATHTQPARFPFAAGVYRSLKIPLRLVKSIVIKGMPLLVNEMLWSGGTSILAMQYSMRGINVVSAFNISNTVANLFSFVFFSMGSATSIIIGQELGRNDIDTAKDHVWKLCAFSMVLSACTAVLLAVCSPFIPLVYKTEPEIRRLATRFLLVYAAFMPSFSFNHTAYFTIRSGGKTFVTFLFDCGFVWAVNIPLVFLLVKFTSLNIVWIYFAVQVSDLLKDAIAFVLLKKGIWLNNMVSK